MSVRNHRKGQSTWTYKAVAVAAASAAVLGVVGSQVFPVGTAKTAVELIRQSPPPALFPDSSVNGWTTQLAEQKRAADDLFGQWRKQHGTARDDKAFLPWVAQHVPAPPPAAQRSAETEQLQKLARARTAAGRRAATWLDVHGQEDIWQLYLSDQRELLPAAQGGVEHTQFKTALSMALKVKNQLDARYRQPSPYVLDPSLRPEKNRGKKSKAGNTCPCSYPSSHAASSAAAVTLLTSFAPRRSAEFRWMEAEVAYSRIYMAGHVPSDILAGALLGDLIGDYVLTSTARTDSAHSTQPSQ